MLTKISLKKNSLSKIKLNKNSYVPNLSFLKNKQLDKRYIDGWS